MDRAAPFEGEDPGSTPGGSAAKWRSHNNSTAWIALQNSLEENFCISRQINAITHVKCGDLGIFLYPIIWLLINKYRCLIYGEI